MAGKAIVRDGNIMKEKLLAIRKPLMIIPNLAIHLSTAEERKAFAVNAETHLQVLNMTNIFYDGISKIKKRCVMYLNMYFRIYTRCKFKFCFSAGVL